jgi:hypothetical protein
VVLGDDRKGNHFFLDCYSEPDTFLAACREDRDVRQAVQPTTRRIYSERAGQQVAFAHALRQELLKENILIAVDDTKIKPEGKAKELRIMEMEPIYQRGVFYVGTGPKFHEFKRQYSAVPARRSSGHSGRAGLLPAPHSQVVRHHRRRDSSGPTTLRLPYEKGIPMTDFDPLRTARRVLLHQNQQRYRVLA